MANAVPGSKVVTDLTGDELIVMAPAAGAVALTTAQAIADLGSGGGGGGSGTVTAVSVATANGVSGSVANPTTTPAITVSLGAITPASVVAPGVVSGGSVAATNGVTGAIVTAAGVVSGGSVSAAGAVAGATVTAAGAVSGASVAAAGAITAGTTITAGGAISGSDLTAAGVVSGGSVSATGTVAGATATIAGIVSGGTLRASATISAGTSITAGGVISGGSVAAANGVTGTTMAATGAVTGASVAATGAVTGATVAASAGITAGTTISAGGAISGAGLAVTGTVAGANVAATAGVTGASVTATGTVSGATVSASGAVNAASGAVSGVLTVGTVTPNLANLKAVSETYTAPVITAGSLTVNLALGSVFLVNNDANITSFNITNAPAGKATSFTIQFTSNGTAYTQDFSPATWPGGTAPTLASVNAKRDVLTFMTLDGTTWMGFPTGLSIGSGPPGTSTMVVAGDSLATIQTKLNSVTAGNSLVFPAGESFNLGGNLVGKDGITLWAAGTCTITNGEFEFSNCDNWTIRGVSSTQNTESGFLFDDVRVNCAGVINGVIANCTFENHTSVVSEGSAINLYQCNGVQIINCTFNDCDGNVIAHYDMNDVLIDGCHFNNCDQVFALQVPHTPNTAMGNDIVIRRNVCLGTKRAAFEMGPAGNQYFNGIIVEDNFMDAWNHANVTPGTPAPDLLPISCVGANAINTTIQNNYLRKGPINSGTYAVGLEISGSGTCTGNTMVNFAYGICYQTGAVFTGNDIYNDGSNVFFGIIQSGAGSSTRSPNTTLGSPPAVPAHPLRVPYV